MTPADFRLEPEGNGAPAPGPATAPTVDPVVVGPSLSGVRRVFYLLGALLCAVLAWRAFRPNGGVLASAWWWDVLVPGAGEPWWTSTRVYAMVLGVVATTYLVCAVLQPGRVRAAVTLTVSAVAFAAWYGRHGAPVEDSGALGIGFALVVAGAMAVSARLSSFAGRVVLAAGLALLASQLFLPYSSREREDLTGAAAPAEEIAAVQWVERIAHPPDGRSSFAALVEVPNLYMAVLLAAEAIGLLVLLGLSGRWALWAAGVLGVAMAATLPAVVVHWERSEASGDPLPSYLDALRPLGPWFSALVLPVVAGVLDALASGRERRSLGV